MAKSKKQVGAVVRRSGVSFRVWAPFANNVAVTGTFNDWGITPLISEEDGYWFAEIKNAQPGQEYKYVITNDDKVLVKNDPRALQVTTSAGNSVITDPEFEWGDTSFTPRPVSEQVVYEMHVGTFNRPDESSPGTFELAKQKLDYLADLGITTIEIMPIASMSMNREWWGYTPNYIYAVEMLYGGRHQFLDFIKAAHERGIAVILDVVYNHLGPDQNLELWQFDGWSEDGKGGIYFYNDWRSKTPWSDTRPDYGRPEVQQYILDNVRMWLTDFRLDGLRVDSTIFIRNAAGHNDDPSTDIPEGWALLQRINRLAKKINPNAFVVAEDMGANDYITKSQTEGGAGFSAQWAVDLPYTLRVVLNAIHDTDRNFDELCAKLGRYFNGDAFRRVIYSDSHDSAANGSARLDEEISPGNPTSLYARKRSLLAATIILTAPGIPMLLQGQEFMQGGSFSDWEALDWEKAAHFSGIVEAHKHLIGLRKNQYSNTAGLTGQSIRCWLITAGKMAARTMTSLL
jgi:1,4-alpha-glucan branching enzyme